MNHGKASLPTDSIKDIIVGRYLRDSLVERARKSDLLYNHDPLPLCESPFKNERIKKCNLTNSHNQPSLTNI